MQPGRARLPSTEASGGSLKAKRGKTLRKRSECEGNGLKSRSKRIAKQKRERFSPYISAHFPAIGAGVPRTQLRLPSKSQRPSPTVRSPVSPSPKLTEKPLRLSMELNPAQGLIAAPRVFRHQIFRDVFQADGTHKKELFSSGEEEEGLQEVEIRPRDFRLLDEPMPAFRLLHRIRTRRLSP